MTATIVQPDIKFTMTVKLEGWKAIMTAISSLHEENVFTAKPDGIMFKVLDPSKVSLIEFFWQKENMLKYECSEEFKVGVRVEEVVKALKRFKEDIVIINYLSNKTLQIISGKKEYVLRTIDPSYIADNPPLNVNYDVSFKTTMSELQEVIEDSGVFEDWFEISVIEKSVYVLGAGDAGKSKSLLSENVKNKLDENFTVYYSYSYISQIVRLMAKMCGNVLISFGKGKPILLGMEVEGVGTIEYFLAPMHRNQ